MQISKLLVSKVSKFRDSYTQNAFEREKCTFDNYFTIIIIVIEDTSIITVIYVKVILINASKLDKGINENFFN